MRRIRLWPLHWEFTSTNLTEFISLTERGLTDSWRDFASEFDKQTKGMTKDEEEEYVNYAYDEIARVRDIAPALLRASHVMVIYGAFENELLSICKAVALDKVKEVMPGPKWHVHEAKKALQSKLKLPDDVFGEAWEFVDSTRLLRNAIAHRASKMYGDKDGQDLCEFAQAHTKFFEVNGHGIVVRKPFARELLARCDKVVARVVAAVKKNYPKN
jgi:hypothetical protein